MSITVRDGTGQLRTVETLPAVGRAAMVASLPVTMASDQPSVGVLQAGSTGRDYSANPIAIPVVGSNVLLGTIPANAARACIEVQNQANAEIQMVRDDGAGNNQSSFLMLPYFSSWRGSWRSQTFKGRLRIYGPAGSSVAVFED
ncbi:MAG: hypothetical protein JSS66_19020 [Armatimonadetes bacterium]|nr:hypothetical protein [Armatimonadota bacterium]